MLTQWSLMPYIDGLMQERRNSIANTLELLQSCPKPSIWHYHPGSHFWNYSIGTLSCISSLCISFKISFLLVQVLVPGGLFKNTYELLNLSALKYLPVNKIYIFHCIGKIFCVEFQRYLWNSTQNILPIHWKIWFVCNIEILKALRFN